MYPVQFVSEFKIFIRAHTIVRAAGTLYPVDSPVDRTDHIV